MKNVEKALNSDDATTRALGERGGNTLMRKRSAMTSKLEEEIRPSHVKAVAYFEPGARRPT